MRRLAPLCLVLLVVGCKSPEEKACENIVRINEAHAAESGRSDGKSSSDHQRGCLDSLRRLQGQLEPSEDEWFTYLACVRAAEQMSDQAKCLAPLVGQLGEPGRVQ